MKDKGVDAEDPHLDTWRKTCPTDGHCIHMFVRQLHLSLFACRSTVFARSHTFASTGFHRDVSVVLLFPLARILGWFCTRGVSPVLLLAEMSPCHL